MEKKIKECNPSICLCKGKNTHNELMTNDGIYVTKEIYKTLCDSECKSKSNCGIIVDLLANDKTDEAMYLISNVE